MSVMSGYAGVRPGESVASKKGPHLGLPGVGRNGVKTHLGAT